MKKWLGITVGISAAIVCGAAVMIGVRQTPMERETFEFSPEVYEKGEFREITMDEFEQMIAVKKSFLVVPHMTVCPAEFPITDVARRLANENGMTIYGLTEEEFRKTELTEVVKYLPSAALYRDGELIDYLDAEDDGDMEYYKSVEGLKEWIGIR